MQSYGEVKFKKLRGGLLALCCFALLCCAGFESLGVLAQTSQVVSTAQQSVYWCVEIGYIYIYIYQSFEIHVFEELNLMVPTLPQN